MKRDDKHKAGEPEPAAEERTPAPEPAADACAEAEQLRAEVASLRDRHLRLQAEFDNFRKRQQREREHVQRQAKERLLHEVPGILDNLERALRSSRTPDAAPEALAQGVELVAKQIEELLARFGAEPIAALGAPFDPHLHEAMARIETAGEPPDGTVVEEYRRGYLLDGKVLRPALVGVAKLAGEEPAESET